MALTRIPWVRCGSRHCSLPTVPIDDNGRGVEKYSTFERKRISTTEELNRFFAECDQREKGELREPDWEEHLQLLQQSRTLGLPQL